MKKYILLFLILFMCSVSSAETTKEECQNMYDNCQLLQGKPSKLCDRYKSCGAVLNDVQPSEFMSSIYLETCDMWIEAMVNSENNSNVRLYAMFSMAFCIRHQSQVLEEIKQLIKNKE